MEKKEARWTCLPQGRRLVRPERPRQASAGDAGLGRNLGALPKKARRTKGRREFG
jgi:hypothetical protein